MDLGAADGAAGPPTHGGMPHGRLPAGGAADATGAGAMVAAGSGAGGAVAAGGGVGAAVAAGGGVGAAVAAGGAGAVAHDGLSHPRGHPATTGAPSVSSALTASNLSVAPSARSASISATMPLTWGADILVPVSVFRPPLKSALRILWPAGGGGRRTATGRERVAHSPKSQDGVIRGTRGGTRRGSGGAQSKE